MFNMSNLILIFISVLIIILSVIVVSDIIPDRGRCLISKSYMSIVPIMTGSTTIMIPSEQSSCVLWEFPNGRPSNNN